MNEELKKLSIEIVDLLNNYENTHVNLHIQALLSIAISMAYQFVDKGKEKDYVIKMVASKLDFFEKNYNNLRDSDFLESENCIGFKIKSTK